MADLAALLSLCAQARADGTDGDGAAWAATAALLGPGGLDAARAELRDRRDPAPLERLARATAGDEAVDAARRARLAARIASPTMLAALWLLADAAEEGKNVVLSMLVVGLIFLAVIGLGELTTTASAPQALDRAKLLALASTRRLSAPWPPRRRISASGSRSSSASTSSFASARRSTPTSRSRRSSTGS